MPQTLSVRWRAGPIERQAQRLQTTFIVEVRMDNQNRDQNVGGGQGGGQQQGGNPQSEKNKDWNQGGSQQQPESNPSQGGGSNPSQGGGKDFDRGSQGQG